jgi:hypothetical protein
MDEYDDENSHVGSPSPPYEGLITEEAEKQLEGEAQNGDFEENGHDEGDEVNNSA